MRLEGVLFSHDKCQTSYILDQMTALNKKAGGQSYNDSSYKDHGSVLQMSQPNC